jgi:hypothetical protein
MERLGDSQSVPLITISAGSVPTWVLPLPPSAGAVLHQLTLDLHILYSVPRTVGLAWLQYTNSTGPRSQRGREDKYLTAASASQPESADGWVCSHLTCGVVLHCSDSRVVCFYITVDWNINLRLLCFLLFSTMDSGLWHQSIELSNELSLLHSN